MCISCSLHIQVQFENVFFTIVLAYFSGYGKSDKSFARVVFCDVGGFFGGAGFHVSNLLTVFFLTGYALLVVG